MCTLILSSLALMMRTVLLMASKKQCSHQTSDYIPSQLHALQCGRTCHTLGLTQWACLWFSRLRLNCALVRSSFIRCSTGAGNRANTTTWRKRLKPRLVHFWKLGDVLRKAGFLQAVWPTQAVMVCHCPGQHTFWHHSPTYKVWVCV